MLESGVYISVGVLIREVVFIRDGCSLKRGVHIREEILIRGMLIRGVD